MLEAGGKALVTMKGPYGNLICPRCGYTHLHHGDVRINNRADEDKAGFATTVSSVADVSIKPTQSFEGRRSDLAIEFWCEGCESSGRMRLVITQHKGETEMYWLDGPLDPL